MYVNVEEITKTSGYARRELFVAEWVEINQPHTEESQALLVFHNATGHEGEINQSTYVPAYIYGQ